MARKIIHGKRVLATTRRNGDFYALVEDGGLWWWTQGHQPELVLTTLGDVEAIEAYVDEHEEEMRVLYADLTA